MHHHHEHLLHGHGVRVHVVVVVLVVIVGLVVVLAVASLVVVATTPLVPVGVLHLVDNGVRVDDFGLHTILDKRLEGVLARNFYVFDQLDQTLVIGKSYLSQLDSLEALLLALFDSDALNSRVGLQGVEDLIVEDSVLDGSHNDLVSLDS